jgi:hypothetical protein
MLMTLIRKKFELVPSGVFRSFWTLQDRLNAFSYKKKKKKIAVVCPESRANFQREFLKTKE